MSEAKFTEGEWWVNSVGKHWNNPAITNHQICYSEIGECVVDHVYKLEDAYLIAAAPENYHANIGAMRLLESLGLESSDEYQELLHATAKARGENYEQAML